MNGRNCYFGPRFVLRLLRGHVVGCRRLEPLGVVLQTKKLEADCFLLGCSRYSKQVSLHFANQEHHFQLAKKVSPHCFRLGSAKSAHLLDSQRRVAFRIVAADTPETIQHADTRAHRLAHILIPESSEPEHPLKAHTILGSLASQGCRRRLLIIQDLRRHQTNLDHILGIVAFWKGLDLRREGLGDFTVWCRLVIQ